MNTRQKANGSKLKDFRLPPHATLKMANNLLKCALLFLATKENPLLENVVLVEWTKVHLEVGDDLGVGRYTRASGRVKIMGGVKG